MYSSAVSSMWRANRRLSEATKAKRTFPSASLLASPSRLSGEYGEICGYPGAKSIGTRVYGVCKLGYECAERWGV